MDLIALENCLKVWWHDLLPSGSNPTDAFIFDSDGPQPFIPPHPNSRAGGAIAYFSYTSLVRENYEEISWATDPGTQKQVPTISGMRHVVVSIRVDTFDQRNNNMAQPLAERARTRLALPRIVDYFATNGYSIQETRPAIALPFQQDERLFSRAAFEIVLGYLHTETETDSTAFDTTIDHIQVASNTLNGPDGQPISPQISKTIDRP